MATAKAKAGAITPPPVSRGGRKSTIPAEVVADMVEAITGGSFATAFDDSGNPVAFLADGKSDKAIAKARQQANTAAMRHKKAILNSPDNDYSDPKSLMTRVWESEEGTFVFAIGEKPAKDDDDDAGEEREIEE